MSDRIGQAITWQLQSEVKVLRAEVERLREQVEAWEWWWRHRHEYLIRNAENDFVVIRRIVHPAAEVDNPDECITRERVAGGDTPTAAVLAAWKARNDG